MMYEESALDTCVDVICQVPAAGPLAVSYALIATIAAAGAGDAVVVVTAAPVVVVETRVVVVELDGDEFDEQLVATRVNATLSRRVASRIQRAFSGIRPLRRRYAEANQGRHRWIPMVRDSTSVHPSGRQLAAINSSTSLQYASFPGIP
jgi:hypothetical protein